MRKSFDVILIGGGIMGCCIAHELSLRGLCVAIVEKGQIGGGPSGDSAAIIRQHYSNKVTAEMAHHGVGVFSHFEDLIGTDCGFKQTGFAVLAPESHRSQLDVNLALQQSIGIKTSIISLQELQELFPGTPTRENVVCVFEPESGYADAVATVKAYAAAANRQGTTIFEETEVYDVCIDSDRVNGVRSTAGMLTAPCVINCAGAWGARVAGLVGIDVPINSCRAQVAVLDKPAIFPQDFPVVIDFTNGSFIRPYSNDTVFGGLVDPTEADSIVDPDSYSRAPDSSFLTDTSARLHAAWPRLRDSLSIDGYASLYAITPDWHPIVDELPGAAGFYICSGFSGHGFKLAPAVGRMTADMITEDTQPLFDRTAFRISRFAESSALVGSYKYSILG